MTRLERLLAGAAAALVLTIGLPQGGWSQTTEGLWRSHPVAPVPAVVERAEERGAERGAERGFSWAKVAHRVGGALVGGWLGYVGSQVVHSDWDKEVNGAFRSQRSLWSAAGALLGVAGSQLIGATEAPVMVPEPLEPFHRERRAITAAEIRESRASNAHEVVSRLRPEWLVTRATERGRGDRLVVYLNGVRLGDVDRMRQVSSESLTGARFLDSRAATQRYGMGHPHGAILLSTATRAP